ncbi:MAG: DivIVA domain-containing protein [Bowdeniella nasicola]|nr:DivIVA domain-containing protein [Bowdeniella nasicola]
MSEHVMFARESRGRDGYNVTQVEDFFRRARMAYEGDSPTMSDDDVRNATFDQERGGYQFAAVDHAMDRLEVAFVKRRRADFIATHGQDTWMEHIADRARTLYPRLQRPAGDKFRDADDVGYKKTDVDQLLDELVDYFDDGAQITSQEIREITFPSAKKANAYDPAVVDVYLERVVEVLTAVE